MQLTKDDYFILEPYRATIKHVANGGSTSKSEAWWSMNTVNIIHTGEHLISGCTACMVEDYRRFANMIEEYEIKLFNETNIN